MAERVEQPAIPASVAVLPFLFMAPRTPDPDWDFHAALAAALAAEDADTERRTTLRRVAYLLCELGHQYGRRTGDYDAAVPLSRAALACSLGISLGRIKRILGLLALSGVVEANGEALRVLDWRRLCAAAAYDSARLAGAIDEEDEPALRAGEEPAPPALTAAGDPACFV